MKLSDLKTGMWVKTRDGCMYLVLRDHVSIEDGIFIDNSGFLRLKNYNDEMIDVDSTEYDIIEVFIPDLDTYTLNGDCLISVWKRRELPKLGSFEKVFLMVLRSDLKNGWLTMDKDGCITIHCNKPVKLNTMWQSDGISFQILSTSFYPLPFSWASWEDEEPWYIPDLLKEDTVDESDQ